PLVDVMRMVDNPPKTRNVRTSSLMRRFHLSEELGLGWDKIVIACELARLPAPRVELYPEHTKVTIFAKRPLKHLSLSEKIWACYLHACIKYVVGEQLTNASLRERFGLKDVSMATASRLIKQAVEKDFIKPLDDTAAPKYMKYVPIWA
ncbi:MAG: ATP-binding protein, partial [Anaerovoracaceae bacterium]